MARDAGKAGLDPQRLVPAAPEGGQLPGPDAARQHLGLNDTAPDPDARPRKGTTRLLWAGFALFVLYGTTFPFRFTVGWDGFLSETARINWRPLGGSAENVLIADIVQNILLFIPFGFLGYFSLVYKRSWLRKAGIVLAGAALSAGVELLQVFSPIRYPALSDVLFNTLGTAAGLFLAMTFKKSVLRFKSQPMARRFLDAPSVYPAFVFMVVMVAGAWMPFDFSLDVHVVLGHLRYLLDSPIRFDNPDDDMVSLIRHLLASLFICRLAAEAGLPRPAMIGALFTAAFGIALEAGQAFIQSRTPDVEDAVMALFGALCGGVGYFFPGFHRRPRVWTAAGGLMILVSAAARALYPYRFGSEHNGFNWIPFLPHWQRSTFNALGDFAESALIFFPLGFLLGYFYPRIRPSVLAAMLAGTIALWVEGLQGFVPGRYAEVTDVLGAMLGAAAGGLALTRGWPAFRDYMRRDDDAQI